MIEYDPGHFTARDLGDFLTIHQHIDNVINVSWWPVIAIHAEIQCRALPHARRQTLDRQNSSFSTEDSFRSLRTAWTER